MTIALPTAVNLHTLNHNVDARARGITNSAVQALKPGGNLPLTTNAAVVANNTASSQTGTWTALHWEFLATGGYDVSSETRVAIFNIQFATADRIQISDLANDGIAIRIGSGTGSPPSNYKHYQVGGRDRPLASSMVQSLPVVIDLNDTSNESTGGTFDNTDIQTYGPGNVRWDMFGTLNSLMVLSRVFVFTTDVDSADIPTFTGTGSNWDDLVDFIQGADFTDKIGEWCFRNGSTVVVPIPWQIGDGTTATTFNDNSDTIVGPPHNDVNDPRFRLTSQALRGYIRLRNNAADIVTLSGTYNYIDSNKPDLDFDVSNAAVITLTGSTWIGRGPVTLGSSVAGAATWDRCSTVDATAGPDVDGSIFKSPTGDALLIDSTQTLADLRFESYTGQVALNVGAGASNVTITLDNCFFDKTGTFEVENSGSGIVTLIMTNGTALLVAADVTNTGGGSIVISNTQPIKISGVTEGTSCKIVADETIGTVIKGDVLMEAFADSTGLASASINYEPAFDPSGLDVLSKARNQGIAVAAIAEDGGVFTDETAQTASVSINDMTLLPAVPVANDAYNFAHTEQFNRFKIDITTVLTQSVAPTFAVEFWNGAWVAVSGLVDGTNGYETLGENVISFTAPVGWVTNTINTQGPFFYVRIRIVTIGTITQVPIARTATIDATRFLPYAEERIITSTGLADIAAWQEDTISKFIQE